VKTFRTDNVNTITECVEAVFPLFDIDGSGEVDVNEFTMRDGLCDTIIASVASLI
jgi:Ca2+-binding EF-hand superfamily protein